MNRNCPFQCFCFVSLLFMQGGAMEPLALLATQPVWQAGQPITLNVDYDGGLVALHEKTIVCCVCWVSSCFWHNG